MGTALEVPMSYLYLFTAILFEVAGTSCMKASHGFERLGPSLGVLVCYALSLGALTLTLKRLDVSLAYAIWAGLGTALIALVGWAVFDERMTLGRVGAIALIVAGVVWLHLSQEPEAPSSAAAEQAEAG